MMDRHAANSCAIICTRNRPKYVSLCLDSIRAQVSSPSTVIVVDSSTDAITEAIVSASGLSSLKYVRSDPGLTHQRNVGRAMIPDDTQFVHFVDDDVLLDANYLGQMEEILSRPGVVGAAGAMRLVHSVPRRGFLGGRPGSVTRYGKNVQPAGGAELAVDWFPGCAMSYRAQVIRQVQFDERRLGNGHGEDVDFCLRVGRLGELIWTPHIGYTHLHAVENRDEFIRESIDRAMHRRLLAQDRAGKVRITWVLIYMPIEVAATLVRLWGKSPRDGLRAGIAYARTLFSR